MLAAILKEIFTRDLIKLKLELNAYDDESQLWLIDKQITNSAGNLSLHIIGNLKTYIGGILGNTHYIRNRPLEFSQKNVPRAILINQIDELVFEIEATLNSITNEALEAEYPIQVIDKKTSTAFLLTHLTLHLNYHLGQINYHRRLLAS